MQNNNITKEILDLEKKYWMAMADHDLEMAISLTDFPCIIAGAHGSHIVDRAEYEKMFNSHQTESISAFDFDESRVEVRQLSPDTVVVAYKVQATMERDGKSKSMDAVDTSTWIRRDGKWVCAMHTETELLQ